MAATVVSVVIFLCGVLVGRGVRTERAAAAADTATAAIEPAPQTTVPAATPAGSDPTAAAAPPPTVDDLSYFNRLEKQTQPAEDLRATPKEPPAPTPVVKTPVKVTPAPAPPPPAPAAATATTPAGDGYVIQVAAMLDHGDGMSLLLLEVPKVERTALRATQTSA